MERIGLESRSVFCGWYQKVVRSKAMSYFRENSKHTAVHKLSGGLEA